MDELVAFLKDRLTETEEVAYANLEPPLGHRARSEGHPLVLDGKFVLADVAAKRQIIEGHRLDTWRKWDDETKTVLDAPFCETCAVGMSCTCCLDDADRVWPCQTLKLLALPYQSHSLYQESWKPA